MTWTVFITHCCANPDVSLKNCRQLFAGLVLLNLLLWPHAGMTQTGGLEIREAGGKVENGMYLVNATISYTLGDEVHDALTHGIPLEFVVAVNIKRERAWFWDETIADRRYSYLVEYQPLSSQFVVTELADGSRHQFQYEEDALEFIGTAQGLSLTSIANLAPDNDYYAQMKAYLNIQTLPAPLRPLAYFSAQWRLQSRWQTWQVSP